MSVLTFTVAFPGGLGIGPNQRVHWTQRSSRNRLVRDLTAGHALAAVRSQHWPCAEMAIVDFVVKWQKNGRLHDEDNLRAQLKPVIDGLVDARVFFNDGPGHLKLGTLEQTLHNNTHWPLVKITITNTQEIQHG